ncbi:MAG TPA: 2-dehydro-3-deoxygalactonokinase [Burkholderiales bacterium]|nr:2-dehydro-3-deoxygalactonokinase [Burkholderiales bacterium]
MIAIDWGTSSFRAYRLDALGSILESRASNQGIMNVAPGQFPRILEEQIRGWEEGPIVMSGMVGSRQGWAEAPYVPCPAGFDEIAACLHDVRWGGRSAWIVPGLSCRDAAGVLDVMRGEETQILGCGVEGTVCLPGTHSKWIEVKNGRIERFCTFMTGEVYAVLKQHSILGRMMEEGKPDAGAFADGVRRSGQPGGLLHHLFGVRTRGLAGELGPAASASYLSGIVIGHELRTFEGKSFALLGAPDLAALYQQAAAGLGIETRTLDANSAVRSLHRLGVMLRR